MRLIDVKIKIIKVNVSKFVSSYVRDTFNETDTSENFQNEIAHKGIK